MESPAFRVRGAGGKNGYLNSGLFAAGYLNNSNGALNNRGSNGNYWSSTQNSSTNGYNLNFNSSDSNMNNNNKAYGFSVRCLKDWHDLGEGTKSKAVENGQNG